MIGYKALLWLINMVLLGLSGKTFLVPRTDIHVRVAINMHNVLENQSICHRETPYFRLSVDSRLVSERFMHCYRSEDRYILLREWID